MSRKGGTVLMELEAYPFSARYGWVQDRFGVSWQVVPDALSGLLSGGTPEQSKRVMAAMLTMVKLDVEGLTRAWEGK